MVIKFVSNRHAQLFIMLAIAGSNIPKIVLSDETVTYTIYHHDDRLQALAEKVNAMQDDQIDTAFILGYCDGLAHVEVSL